MIDFMVLSLPRSASTWCSNWLTTDVTLCLHDPLWTRHYSELDQIVSSKRLGVACTGLFLFPQYLSSHPARKVILHRNLDEINASMEAIGLPPSTQYHEDQLNKIEGMHVPYTDIFTRPEPIYEFLLERPFDQERHAVLLDIEMQPAFAGLKIGKDVTRRLLNELGKVG